MRHAILAPLILGLLSAQAGYTQKPILPDFHADPSAHQWDGRYWIYPSHDLAGVLGPFRAPKGDNTRFS